MPEEIKQEVVLKTQKYLGKYVKKPPLTEKLLKKPPFRFLHDIINAVIKETGFLKGLFSDDELNSENVKERDAKVAFLSKLIDAVKVITNTDLAVRPSKIVAGLEPTETNLLLQAIGKAIDKKLDSSEYIKQLNSGQTTDGKNKKPKRSSDKNEKLKKPTKSTTNEEKTKNTSKHEKQSNETPKSTDRNKTKRSLKESKGKTETEEVKSKNKEKSKKKEKVNDQNKEIEPNEIIETSPPQQTEISKPEETSSDVINDNVEQQINKEPILDNNEEPQDESNKTIPVKNEIVVEPEPLKRRNSASRPKSARPRSGDLKEKIQEENKEPVILSRPKSSLRPPSVRPSSARPGAPRLRPDSGFPIKEIMPMGKINVIVENFDKDVDEEETVIIQNNPEIIEEQSESIVDVPGDNKGHLVEQILEQINEGEGDAKIDSDWQKDGFQSKETTSKETNNLRSLIQTLTKTANPLGKLLNYLHEDIDAMHSELESWTNTKRQLFDEIAKQKKISAEMNKPLISQLEHLIEDIKKVEEEIVSTRSNILRNELKIKELLAK